MKLRGTCNTLVYFEQHLSDIQAYHSLVRRDMRYIYLPPIFTLTSCFVSIKARGFILLIKIIQVIEIPQEQLNKYF
jgi:hypothetical protein